MVGLDGILYYDTATYASPTWAILPNVKDLQIPGDVGSAEGSSRAARWKSFERTLRELGLSFGYIKKVGDTLYALLQTNFFTDVNMDVAIADGPIATTGTKYIRIQLGIFKWEQVEPLEGIVMANIEMKCVDGITHPPVVTTVA